MKMPMNVLAATIGLVLGLPLSPTHASMGGKWTPAQWFLANEQGIWLDPSDFTRYMSELGPELSEDLSFDNTSKWNKGSGWSVTGGQAVHNGAAADYVNSLFTPVVGKTYKYVLDIAEIPAGSNVMVYCNGVSGPMYTAPGVYTATIFCSLAGVGAIKHSVRASNASGGTTRINSFSIKEVISASTATMFQDSAGTTPVTAVEQPVGLALDKRLGATPLADSFSGPGSFNSATGWSVGAGYAITGGKLVATAVANAGTSSYVGAVGIGKWYKVTVVVSAVTSGSLRIECGNAASPVYTAAGTYTYHAYTINNFCVVQSMAAGSSFSVESIALQELPGNHASQSTTAQKPVLSARKNKLDATDTMSSGSWLVSGTATRTTGVADPFGGTTAVRINLPAADGSGFRSTTPTWAANENVVISVWMRSDAVCTGWVQTNSGILIPGMVLNLTPDWQKFEISIAGGSADSQLWFARRGGAYGSATMIEMCQPDAASGPMRPYQRVNTNTDYDTVGFPHYLKFDGVDDNLVTGNIDFSATDKMTEVMGISVNNGTFGVIHELSASLASNTGAFGRFSGVVSSRHYPTVIRGSAAVSGYAGMASATQPDLCVLSATHDIAGDLTRARRNGVYGADETTDKGTGNLGNYPLYIGRRGGTSSPANMNLYQFVLRGAATADLTPGEAHAAAKTGITF